MCKFKSAIILKDRVYIHDTDSHEEMLKQLKIKDDYLNAQKTFVRAELFPSNGDFFSNIEEWNFKINQDILPDWFDETVDKPRMIEAVKEWAKNRIYIGINSLNLNDGTNYMLKDCINVILSGNSKVNKIFGNSKIEIMFNNSEVNEMYDNSKINMMYDNSKIEVMYNNSKVSTMRGGSKVNRLCDNSKVNKMYDSARINVMGGDSEINEMHNHSFVNIYSDRISADTIKLFDNSAIRDFITKTIYQIGNWKLNNKK